MGIPRVKWVRERVYFCFDRSFTASFEGVAGASASAGSKTPNYTNVKEKPSRILIFFTLLYVYFWLLLF